MRMIHALNQKRTQQSCESALRASRCSKQRAANSAQNEVLKARLTRVSLLKAACS